MHRRTCEVYALPRHHSASCLRASRTSAFLNLTVACNTQPTSISTAATRMSCPTARQSSACKQHAPRCAGAGFKSGYCPPIDGANRRDTCRGANTEHQQPGTRLLDHSISLWALAEVRELQQRATPSRKRLHSMLLVIHGCNQVACSPEHAACNERALAACQAEAFAAS